MLILAIGDSPIKPDIRHFLEEIKTYNPSVIFDKGEFHLFYRAVGKNGRSSIGYAEFQNGKKFLKHSSPVITPEKKLRTTRG